MVRHFLADDDLTPAEQGEVLGLAADLKAKGRSGAQPLAGLSVAVVFEKPSTRTRLSFEVGIAQLGAHPLVLDARSTQLGRGETIEDTARVLSRYVDGIMIRTFAHADVEELAKYATVPVINGLTDLLHPCQVLTDLFTMREHVGGWDGKVVAWIGDGNNMANSWLNAAAVLGFELRLACPEGYEPNHDIFDSAKAHTKVSITEDIEAAVRGAHAVNTDVWASMGQEEEQQQRALAFQGYQVSKDLMKLAAKDAIFLHCLPAHRGEEVTEEVFEGRQSRVFDQAENRLHVQKAIMATLMGG